jgi:energy-coupling factor transporter ATP-binding protein EcfA2
MSAQPIIRIEGLHHQYEEGVPALDGVDLTIAEGAFLAIVGQNGSGKTTLAKHLNGLLKPTSGRVVVDGVDTAGVPVSRLALTVGYLFQNPDHQIFCATTREEVGFGLRNLGLAPEEVERRAEEALADFALTRYAETPPAVLGFGLRRAVTVASVFAMRQRILVLDEPTTGLDWRMANDLLRRVATLHAAGHTILLITHDMRLVAAYAPETLVMHEGRVLAHGPTREILAEAAAMRGAHLTPPQVTRLAQALAPHGLPGDVLTVDEFCRAYRAALGGTP